MHVVVLGAGVIGVTTAYYLSENGHKVTVVDRAGELASGASGRNGGQLSYSFADAMASPSLFAKFPKILAGLDPAFCLRPPMSRQFLRWSTCFLAQCSSRRHRDNTTAILKMAMRSALLIRELCERLPLEFSYRRAGKLVMQATPAGLAEAKEFCELKRHHGSDVNVITLEQAIEIEPALKHMTNGYTGAVYSELDEVGDTLAFTIQLGRWLSENREVEFRLNTTLQRIDAEHGKVTAVETDRGTLDADAVVVCLGAWSDRYLHPLGIHTLIYPMRGYSVTLPAGPQAASVSITDLTHKMVFSRLGGQVRIAGFADFVGYRTDRDEDRIRTLLNAARKIAPLVADYEAASADGWGGFRPMTADSRPVIGPTPIEGLYLNTGHGMLGWTLACASGRDLADAVEARQR